MSKKNPEPKPRPIHVPAVCLSPQIGGRRTWPKPTLEQLDNRL